MDTGEEIGAIDTIRRGVAVSPELTEGLRGHLALAVVASLGQVVVPIAVQQTLDRGLDGAGGPDVSFTVADGAASPPLAIVVTSCRVVPDDQPAVHHLRARRWPRCGSRRSGTSTTCRCCTQNTERRGALVSRVTSDVDQVSQFLVFGGLLFVVSVGQMLVATVVMAHLQLAAGAVVVLGLLRAAVPVAALLPAQALRRLRRRPAPGRACMLVGDLRAGRRRRGRAVLRRRGPHPGPHRRGDRRVQGRQHPGPGVHGVLVLARRHLGRAGQRRRASIVGVWLGFAGDITAGKVLAFAFLVTLFVGPVQMGTQILTDAQNAIAGWRRVIGILDTPADLVDPGRRTAQALPRGPIDVRFEHVTFAYPGGPLGAARRRPRRSPPARRVAIVGETGSGKSTFAKLLTRLMDPVEGAVLLDGVDVRRDRARPRCGAAWCWCRRRASSSTTPSPPTSATGGSTRPTTRSCASADELGLGDWLAGLPARARDPRSASAASRCRPGSGSWSRCSAPTSPTPTCSCSTRRPAPSTRRSRCGSAGPSSALMSGRTSVTIAHRLSTAENADEVVVVDRGRIVQRGPHAELVGADGVYAGLHASWVAQQGT